MTHKLSRPHYLGAIVIIFLLAAALRLYALEADAPLHMSIYPGLSNDGIQTIAAARDKIVFGSWLTPHAMSNRTLYHNFPAMSWLGYLFFRLFGLGYWQANLISVVTGLLAIAFTGAFARDHFGRRTAVLAMLFMATNYLFIVYNRTPIVYTTLAAVMAFALYLWGKGLLTHGLHWYIAALVVALFGIFYVKILGVVLIPALVAGLLVAGQRRQLISRRTAFISALLTLAIIPVVYLLLEASAPRVATVLQSYFRVAFSRTFRFTANPAENVEFFFRSVLQFGIFSSIFVRMLPLFVLSYGFLFYRSAQLLSRQRPRLSIAELMLLVFAASTFFVLMFNRGQPTRYYVVLIPPMSLTAALALDRWLRSERLRLPEQFGRFYPLIIMLGLAYLVYQLLVAAHKLLMVARLGTGLADYQAIVDPIRLIQLFAVSLIAGLALALLFVWRVKGRGEPQIQLPGRRARLAVAALLVLLVIGSDLFQYLNWARDPQYTLVEASGSFAERVGPDAIVGGSYAYPLAMDSEIRAFYIIKKNLANLDNREALHRTGFTHLIIDEPGSPVYGQVDYDSLFDAYPELRDQVRLSHAYYLRDNLVVLYEVIR
ncbi:MAG: glycosyltransferase family 39 protein [Candidatus Promineifilaceae bacterium]|nr:glycosyltransferase family 39 protein [Candidatus Promineifilaceae bacterium]